MTALRLNVVVSIILAMTLSVKAAFCSELHHPNRLIVKYKHPMPSHYLATSASAAQATQILPLFHQAARTKAPSALKASVFLMFFADSSQRLAAESLLAGDSLVEYAERDYRLELFFDPLFDNQWALSNRGQAYYTIVRNPGENDDVLTRTTGVSGADIGWQQALTANTGRHKARVGIIDTGVDYDHPELRGNIWRNSGEIPHNGIDDDFNGYADDYYGYDFSGDAQSGITSTPDPDPMDSIGHGTHVAGIIGAVGSNGIGIEGIAPNVSIMCIKIFPNAFASATAEAIVYAVDNGAEIINASWGSPYFSSLIADAVRYAVDHGVLFVAAAGNSGSPQPFFPAKLDYVLTVSASNSLDRVTTFSTYGDWIDLAAPGQDILSLRANRSDLYASGGEPRVRIIDSLYYLADGTSMAAPHVCGAAAFLLSVSPGLSRDSLTGLLLKTADVIADPQGNPRPSGSVYFGHGRLNLKRAVAFLTDEFAEVEEPLFNSIQQGEVTFHGSAYSASGQPFYLQAKPASSDEWLEIGAGEANVLRQILGTWDSSPYDGKTEVRLRVGDNVIYSTTLRLVNNRYAEVLSPRQGDSVSSFAEIIGSASAPGFKSYELAFYSDASPKTKHLIAFSNEIVFRSKLADWTVGPLLPGGGVLRLTVATDSGTIETVVKVVITSTLASGYPKLGGTSPHLTAVVGNIDSDPGLELVTGGADWLLVNHYGEGRLESLNPHLGTSYRSFPAIHDFNADGRDEIVVVTDSGVAIIDGTGELLPGWPRPVTTGWEYNSYPTPLVTDMDGDSSMEVLIVDQSGEIFCWRSDGESYFRTTNGLFATIDTTGRERVFGGPIVPFLFAYDFDDDGYQDVGTLYTSIGAQGGLYLYSGKNGRALHPQIGTRVLELQQLFGSVLADFDRDGVAEIAFAHWIGGTIRQMGVSIVRSDGSYLPGWPKRFYDKIQWLSPYPAAADLDRDSIPELVCVFSALDGGEVYVWHGDGTPFLENTFGRSDGFLAGTSNSISNPLVVDVDNDGEYEIVARGGALLFGKPERLFSWELDGTVTKGWPIYTYAPPGIVIYSLFTPVAGDFDGNGFLELYMGSSDRQIYSWELPTAASDTAILWGNFLNDNRHSGILPFPRRVVTSPPAPPPVIPSAYALGQNYPNPFNENTTIQVALPDDGDLVLEILNILGQQVITLHNGSIKAGYYRFQWDGIDAGGAEVGSGVYFCRMRIGTKSEIRKMVLLK